MKIRNGFVSNSSSSSFVLCTNLQTIEQIKDQLLKEFKVPEDSILYGVAIDIIDNIIRLMEKSEYTTPEEYDDYYGGYDQVMSKYEHWYVGNVDDCQYKQRSLSMLEIFILNDNIYLNKPQAR